MSTDDRLTTLLVKLNRLTSIGKLTWETQAPPDSILRGTDDQVPLYVVAYFKGQEFGLYERRYRLYDGENDRFYWSQEVVLALLDIDGRAVWQTSSTSSALIDLFETVRRKVSNVDAVIDRLLAEDDDAPAE